MSLYSSEAEYVALSEAVKEVMFIIQLLESMKVLIEYPVMLKVDNVGAIFMASNIILPCCTKHVDKYVNEYVEDGVVKIAFLKSADHYCNILIKN